MINSRASDDGRAIRRRRQCPRCDQRFTTIETTSLQVIRWLGAYESFSRGKIINGVGKACQGRFVSEDDLTRLTQLVKEWIRTNGTSQTEAHEVGLAILEPLRKLDTIAYLHFTSVYSNYDSLDDFENTVRKLREDSPEPVR